MARSCTVRSIGGVQVVKAIYVHAGGSKRLVKAAYVMDSRGSKRQWWPATGGTTPGGTHTVTLGGHRSGTRWTFHTTGYKPRITRAVLIIHSRSIWSGHAYGYPSGGDFTGLLHIGSGGGSVSHTVSAASFNGATTGVTIHTSVGTSTAVDRVTLRLTYQK